MLCNRLRHPTADLLRRKSGWYFQLLFAGKTVFRYKNNLVEPEDKPVGTGNRKWQAKAA